jgi:hypothetical protein
MLTYAGEDLFSKYVGSDAYRTRISPAESGGEMAPPSIEERIERAARATQVLPYMHHCTAKYVLVY